jgi:cytochrome b subunit of formate dehydrogenase
MEKIYHSIDCYLTSNAFGGHAVNIIVLLITVMIAMTGYIIQKGWCAPANCKNSWEDAQVASSIVVVSAILLVILIVLAKDNDYFKFLTNY